MTIEKARLEAFRHGFDNKKRMYCERACLCDLLTPEWWQSLGKAMGWDDEDPALLISARWKKYHGSEPDGEDYWIADTYHEENEAPLWKYYWHHFIDHLAEGKTAESYFQELTPQ